MYRKILVPLDGSKLAECALEHVRAIAKGCGAQEVVLIRAINPIPYWVYGDYANSSLINEVEKEQESFAEEYLDNVLKELTKDGIAARKIVLKGEPAQNILDYAEKNSVDLIIMTTHGRSGPARWTMGSVAERVTQYSKVPVLVIAPAGCRVIE
jgi:nucleotide-binding universal stress UspA family protein